MKIVEQLIEYESMLHESVQRVGRAVRNMRQEMGGYPSSTPGNGSPGGGKGGGSMSMLIADPNDHHVSVPQDPEVRRLWAESRRPLPTKLEVPVTSVEAQVLSGGRDDAAEALHRLTSAAAQAAALVAAALGRTGRGEPPGRHGQPVGPDRMVVLVYARVRCLVNPTPSAVELDRLRSMPVVVDKHITEIFNLCQVWGYDTSREAVPKDRAELLAVDLTGLRCTSHLRIGERRDRDRGELCQWCRKFEALEGFIPPVDLVRIHVEFRRVRDDQIRPYRDAHRDRQRRPVRK